MREGLSFHFSLEERDRRYTSVREIMAARNLDCLIVRGISSKWDAGTANVRYLSQVGGNGEEALVVFPLEADPTCFIWAPSQLKFWTEVQSWVSDIRLGSPDWARAAGERIQQLRLACGRFGVVGLGGRSEAGQAMSYGIMADLQKNFPEATFEPASDILEKVRYVKSPDEVRCIEKAAELGDFAIQSMLTTARPGISAREVHARMIYTMLRHGGEAPPMMLFGASSELVHATRFPGEKILEPGDLITNEISPKYAGYWAQPSVAVSIGKPKELCQRLSILCIEAFHSGLEVLKPGITNRELAAAINRPIERAGFTWIRPQFQGIGLEISEGPRDRFFPGTRSAPIEEVIQEGTTIVFQPMAATVDGNCGIQLGDTLVVERSGARRLGKFDLNLAVV